MNKNTLLSTYDYFLPDELIAQTPAEPRDHSRLLIASRDGNIEHKKFFDIIDYLHAGDVLVVNNTKVLPARLFASREEGTAKIEVLLLKRLNLTDWEVMVKPGKKCRINQTLKFSDELTGTIISNTDFGGRIIRFNFEKNFEEILLKIGSMPLPHYIKQEIKNPDRYQTVYAKTDGSAAAPTAGFHWTKELLKKAEDKGVKIVNVLLHVGLGTFRPVKENDITNHDMHSEYFEVSEEAAQQINKAKKEGRRVIAVGTTSVRVLESAAKVKGEINASSGETKIFIYPPYEFKIVDAIITNFHLPKSTLLMLVSAFYGTENMLNIYNTAVKEKYRFFSFGDAMFLK